MNKFAPSVLAAGAVAATRICLRVEPRWSESLEIASCLAEADVVPCVIEMLRIYEEANQAHRHDSPTTATQAAQAMMTGGQHEAGVGMDAAANKPMMSRANGVEPVPWALAEPYQPAMMPTEEDFMRVTNC